MKEENKFHLKFEKGNKTSFTDTKKLDFMYSHKSMQVVFSCGVVMGRIDAEIDNISCLYWHFKRSKNIDDFVDSVRKNLSIIGQKLSASDITKLRQQYVNYIEKITNKNQKVIDALTL